MILKIVLVMATYAAIFAAAFVFGRRHSRLQRAARAGATRLDFYRIDRRDEGRACELVLRAESGAVLALELGPVECHALSDALLVTSAEMVRARRGERSPAEDPSS